jgi:hypothetical protein
VATRRGAFPPRLPGNPAKLGRSRKGDVVKESSATTSVAHWSSWFCDFAAAAQKLADQNPIKAILGTKTGCDPSLLTFTLYWYRCPSKTRIEHAVNKARRIAKQLDRAARRLSEDASSARRLLAGMAFSDPCGYQVREVLKRSALVKDGPERAEDSLRCISSFAAKLSESANGLKTYSSGKRAHRSSLEVLLWCHLQETVGPVMNRKFLPLLIDCADSAFGQNGVPIRYYDAVSLSCQRFQVRYPGPYERLKALAIRNKRALDSAELRQWGDLTPADCNDLATELQLQFDKETARRPT